VERRPSVRIEFDPTKRLFSVLPEPDAFRSDVMEAVTKAVRTRPEIAAWDCLADLRNPLSGAYIFDLTPLIPVFDQEDSLPALTVFVTHQARTSSWIGLLNHQFRSRRFCVASSVPQAIKLFDSGPRNDRPWAAL
jgi:hypothetical protein